MAHTGTDWYLRTMFGDGMTPTSLSMKMMSWNAGGYSLWKGAPGQNLGLCVLGLSPLSVATSAQSSWPLRLGSAEDRGLQGLG